MVDPRCVVDIARMPALFDLKGEFRVELPKKLDEYTEEDLRSIGILTVAEFFNEFWAVRTLGGKNYFAQMEKECRENRLTRLHVFSYTLNLDVEEKLSLAEHKRAHKKSLFQGSSS